MLHCTVLLFEGVKTISNIVGETCTAIYNTLKEAHMRVPSTNEEWEKIASDYLARWNYPNCIGSLDGKHIVSVRNNKMLHYKI